MYSFQHHLSSPLLPPTPSPFLIDSSMITNMVFSAFKDTNSFISMFIVKRGGAGGQKTGNQYSLPVEREKEGADYFMQQFILSLKFLDKSQRNILPYIKCVFQELTKPCCVIPNELFT